MRYFYVQLVNEDESRLGYRLREDAVEVLMNNLGPEVRSVSKYEISESDYYPGSSVPRPMNEKETSLTFLVKTHQVGYDGSCYVCGSKGVSPRDGCPGPKPAEEKAIQQVAKKIVPLGPPYHSWNAKTAKCSVCGQSLARIVGDLSITLSEVEKVRCYGPEPDISLTPLAISLDRQLEKSKQRIMEKLQIPKSVFDPDPERGYSTYTTSNSEYKGPLSDQGPHDIAMSTGRCRRCKVPTELIVLAKGRLDICTGDASWERMDWLREPANPPKTLSEGDRHIILEDDDGVP